MIITTQNAGDVLHNNILCTISFISPKRNINKIPSQEMPKTHWFRYRKNLRDQRMMYFSFNKDIKVTFVEDKRFEFRSKYDVTKL